MEDKRSDGPEADGERRPPSTELSAAVVQRYGRRGGNARRSDGEPWRLWQRVVDWVAPLESSPDVTAAAASDSPIGAPARLEIVLPDGSRVRLIGVRQPSGDDRHVVIALSQDRDYPTELLAGLKALTDLPPSRPPSTDVRQAPMSGQIDSSASADASAVDLPSAAAPAGQAVARTTGAEAVADAAPDQLPSLDGLSGPSGKLQSNPLGEPATLDEVAMRQRAAIRGSMMAEQLGVPVPLDEADEHDEWESTDSSTDAVPRLAPVDDQSEEQAIATDGEQGPVAYARTTFAGATPAGQVARGGAAANRPITHAGQRSRKALRPVAPQPTTAGLHVGIDLGTSGISVGVAAAGLKLLQDSQGNTRTPALLAFPRPGEILVGHEAVSESHRSPQSALSGVRELLGLSAGDALVVSRFRERRAFRLHEGSDGLWRAEIHGESYSAVDLVALLLAEVRNQAREAMQTEVRHAVLAAPMRFGAAQREGMVEAARHAGFESVSILTEPSAALLAYGLRGRIGSMVGVLSFGAAFEFSLVEIGASSFSVIAAGGDPMLGGGEIDAGLAGRVTELLGDRVKGDLRRQTPIWRSLNQLCRRAKCELEARGGLRLGLGALLGQPKDSCIVELSRSDLDAVVAPVAERILQVASSVLANARIKPAELESVAMIGAGTNITSLRERVEEAFGRPPVWRQAEQAVVRGTTLRAAELVGDAIGLPETEG
ncbi:MAG: Hsp70 family protein [Deltaproteobacteria bacterium]|nr:Hsp70 family protein [Deltaproteobacteria bacterium]